MRAFVVDKYKKKGTLRLANLPEPEVRDDDVLVRVHATAVNLLDVDKVFPFERTAEALAYVETGRARGKVVIAMKQ
jgi:NADPH:quinone reductase-like Zn-dependent oxidoreductase